MRYSVADRTHMVKGNSFGGAENPLVKNVGAEITCWHDEVYFLLLL